MAIHYPGVPFKGGRGYQRRACTRWGFVCRRTTNFRSSTTVEKLPEIRVYHKELRLIVSTPTELTPEEDMDEIWGRFPREKRVGFDQVPVEFIMNYFESTWTEKGSTRVEVKTPNDSLRKRFCTGHLAFADRPWKEQFPCCLVFRGKGLRISAAERAAYDPRVKVFFQPKAWVDKAILTEITEFFIEFEKSTSYGIEKEALWLGDNLHCQTRPEFRAQMREGMNATVKHYPPKTSDKGCAPVDNGLGAMWKAKIGEIQEVWLENDDNALKWDNDTMTASEKRVVLTAWAGEAWEWCCSGEEKRGCLRRYLEKAGAMMTMDGTGDDLIALEGLPEGFKYEFMDAEIDTEDPAEDDLEEEEEEENEAEIPDMDIEQTPLSELFEDVTEDTTELELCMDDPDAPPGFQLHDLCPDVGNKKYMLGKHVLFRWDCGWAHGVVKRRHTKGKVYNYFVLYKNDDGSSDQWRHGLFSSNYYDAESQPDGVWVLLIPRATYSDEE